MSLRLNRTFRDHLASADRPLYGGWITTGSPVAAEIMAGSGLDWVLIDMEHAPNGLESVLAQLYAVSGYPTTPVVRVPSADTVAIKQVLDLGAQNILVPMVSTAEEAREVAASAQYPPVGRRGVGSALARSARWNRVQGYLANGADHVSVLVQIETVEGVTNAAAIAETPGIDGVFLGPSDLSASMGLLGQQNHPDVVAAVKEAFGAIASTGKPHGVNAFVAEQATSYVRAGATFVLVGADAAILARGSEALAHQYIGSATDGTRASY
ncbi:MULTISPECIES: HpcH/HpaI aldolase family protein [unclassified Rhodococcus (in: high G+C Gram-positive bacteria)]|uniref:HpcH/HpaI aldolase family protein n=1 Tax=unclassified Rhodococcus (in: high G+C Gram-positive bacteria) TaxID=192944 RepID=UPI0006FF5CA3|nr:MULTISPECIES: HpcH/HpaI aldolase/citrate lyase family protein [unclassified Rhodococcus (in: high G+C Gram-positive bacteria)]KQU38463.1 2-dehydro-3-deoxyglucarate aldolase [Rhodococcus sp. Leaf225]KQU39826.1 2-dehydro-3-deoxyglucarate aldolase [Rhodococcus sp. Leaf258]